MFCAAALGGAYAVAAGRHPILAAGGILVFGFTVLLHEVIESQVQALASSLSELGGGASTLLGGILSGVSDQGDGTPS